MLLVEAINLHLLNIKLKEVFSFTKTLERSDISENKQLLNIIRPGSDWLEITNLEKEILVKDVTKGFSFSEGSEKLINKSFM